MRILSLVVVVSLTGLPAMAANPKATASAIEADKLYKAGNYRDAAEALKKAYDLDPIPIYLFNIARAWDQANEEKLALDAYQKYLGLPDGQTQADAVKKSNLALDRLKTSLAKAEAAKKEQDAEKKRLENESSENKKRADAEAERARRQKADYEAKEREQQQASSKKASGRKTGAIIAAGVGVAALASGITFGLLATTSRNDFTAATTLLAKHELQRNTQTQAAVADVSFLLAIAGATAAVLLFPRSEEPSSYISLSVVPSRDGAFASVGGSF